jgi:phage regulator Rha-like protein
MSNANAQSLLTITQIAKALDVTPSRVRRAIEKLNIEPDQWAGHCKLFASAVLDELKSELQAAA